MARKVEDIIAMLSSGAITKSYPKADAAMLEFDIVFEVTVRT
jgi:hypothetical protein